MPVTQGGGTIRGNVSVESAADLGGGVFDEAGPVTVASGPDGSQRHDQHERLRVDVPRDLPFRGEVRRSHDPRRVALNQSGTLRWSNVSMDGVTMPIGSRIPLEGDQTPTGEFVGNGGTTTFRVAGELERVRDSPRCADVI